MDEYYNVGSFDRSPLFLSLSIEYASLNSYQYVLWVGYILNYKNDFVLWMSKGMLFCG